MNAGDFKHPIVIQKSTTSFDEIGNQIESWATYHSCRANINGLSGAEYWAAQAQQVENTVTFEVRYCIALKSVVPQTYRILYDGKIYDVKHIDDFQFTHETLKIKAVRHG